MDNGKFSLFRTRREDDTAASPCQDHCTQEPPPRNIPFAEILQSVKTCSEQEGGRTMPCAAALSRRRTPPFLPGLDSLGTLVKAAEKSKPLHVSKAAYDAILIAQDGWLKSAELRQKPEDLDFPRQLRSVAIEGGRSDCRSLLPTMMEILSEDEC